MRRLFIGFVVLAIAFACGDPSGPVKTPVPSSQLRIVAQGVTAPPLYADSVSFYAVVGQDREVRMYYQGATPGVPGDELLRFRAPGDALLRRPDGTAFLLGDSILIVVKAIDPAKFLFDFRPTGLVFSPDRPAELTLQYKHDNHDYNGDGKVDTADTRIQGLLDVWQHQPPDTLWYPLGAANYESFEELDVKIPHFTDHAIAWRR
jgi:hypothetical protein